MPRRKPLREQVVVVTGATSGIGLATVMRLARAGARVVMVARGKDDLGLISGDLAARGRHVTTFAADEGFPFPLAARPGQMIAEGEDALALAPALAAMATGFASCRVPVRIIGGGCDAVVNNAVQGALAAAMLAQGSFSWVPGGGHMLHHLVPEFVLDACRRLS